MPKGLGRPTPGPKRKDIKKLKKAEDLAKSVAKNAVSPSVKSEAKLTATSARGQIKGLTSTENRKFVERKMSANKGKLKAAKRMTGQSTGSGNYFKNRERRRGKGFVLKK